MRRQALIWSVLCLLIAGSVPQPTQAALAERFSGRVLLDVSNSGEAWYVYPKNLHRYYLGTGLDAYNIMRFLGVGISERNIAKIPTSTESRTGDLALRRRLAGLILLRVESHGEAWYVNPVNLKRYALGGPNTAFQVLVGLAAGITSTRITEIPIATDFSLVPTDLQSYRGFTLTIARGSFPVQVATFNRSYYQLITDTGNGSNCARDCTAKSLATYVQENGGYAGLNGTYFCPPDYSPCANAINSYLPPVFNSAADTMINEDRLRFHSGPMIVQNSDASISFFHRTIDFGFTVAEYEQRTGKGVRAAIANYPSLIENDRIVVNSEPLEASQKTKAVRDAIGYNDKVWFLVRSSSATVADMAYILDALGAKYGLNLDGGGSSALYYNGAYRAGPGRLLPNAVVMKRR